MTLPCVSSELLCPPGTYLPPGGENCVGTEPGFYTTGQHDIYTYWNSISVRLAPRLARERESARAVRRLRLLRVPRRRRS